MSQVYSNPERESDPRSLPDCEVFYVSPMEALYNQQNCDHADKFTIFEAGWYWWACFPGCLPDGPADGPYKTKQEATEAAQNI